MNNWQKWKMKKFNLKESDITTVKMPYITIHWKPVHNEVADFQHYTCTCWTLELLWFIEKFEWKCRYCAKFTK